MTRASALAVDRSGNVFVTGKHSTVGYSGTGVPLWTNRFSGWASAVAVDSNGNVFVTGYAHPYPYAPELSFDYATIAYSGAGVPLWTNRYNGPGNLVRPCQAVAVDGSGNVFVTGYSVGSGIANPDYATIAYSGAGVPLWTNRYMTRRSASAVAVDGSGNVFVTGSAYASGWQL